MTSKYDILFANGVVVDPKNGRNGPLDVAVADGKIVAVSPTIDPAGAENTIDLHGLTVVPGLVDLHVHVSSWIGGRHGHRMMAMAGVTTALDVAGPVESVIDLAGAYGVGLTLGCINYVRPGHTVSSADPTRDELAALLDDRLRKGALGFKILGGHYPLTPEATARTIEVANRRGAYVAFHAGTLATGSNIEGVHEAAALADGHYVHLAHINSYCRGRIRPATVEGEEAIAVLEANPNICSESYLAVINGTSAKCSNGIPESDATKANLVDENFPATERGLADAITADVALINVERRGVVVLASGQEGVAWWRGRETDVTVSFRSNPPEPRLRLATAKRASGDFVVDCLATDGGGIPRNVTVEKGLALVRLDALTIEEFVVKSSRNPARILGLAQKGHLGVGADADITVLDTKRLRPVMTVANGQVIMRRGRVCGRGGRMITTPEGAASIREAGLNALVVDPAETPVCRRPAPLPAFS